MKIKIIIVTVTALIFFSNWKTEFCKQGATQRSMNSDPVQCWLSAVKSES
jgi:hypothetical protein